MREVEVWAPIAEFPIYHVSNFGRVKNSDTGRILRFSKTASGYIFYSLFDGKTYNRFISRLVASAFIGDIEDFVVDHLDNDITNNHVDNLEIVTSAVNIQRSYDRGAVRSGVPVKIVETDDKFRTIVDCARFLNRDPSSVKYALVNGTRTAGYHIEEV